MNGGITVQGIYEIVSSIVSTHELNSILSRITSRTSVVTSDDNNSGVRKWDYVGIRVNDHQSINKLSIN